MQQLTDYMKLQKEIFEYFKFTPDWVVPPIDDRREFWWHLNEGDIKDSVFYAATETDLEDKEADNYYVNDIYTQRFYRRWVYRGSDYTMIMVDTHVDGNKFLAIFDNAKEIRT